MIKKLDIYLSKTFFSILALSILGFLSMFLVVDLIENLDRFIDNNVPSNIVFLYYLYTLPWFISIGLPMSMLIATVFCFGNLVKTNEWTALKASGISIYRASRPLLLIGLTISIFSFILDNKLVTHGNEKRFEIDRDYVKRKSRHKLKNTLKDVFLQKNTSIHISLSKFLINKNIGYDLSWVDLSKSNLTKRVDAKKIHWDLNTSKWNLSDYSIRVFDESGLEEAVALSNSDTLMSLGFIPEEIQQQSRKPDELNYFLLTKRILQLKENGVDTTRWEVTRYLKISFIFTNIIVVLCGIPLVLVREKNSLSAGAGLGVFVIFGYYVLIKFGQSLGFKGILAPAISAWLGNFIFFSFGMILLLRART